MKEYHVSKTGNDQNIGSKESPFLTISRAAKIAVAGDIITVHEGIYREWVSPENGGTSDENRIIYRVAEGEKAVIKGSEVVSDWKLCENNTYQVRLSNELFGEYNPYKQIIDGDWLCEPRNPFRHTGEVYLNGKALHEVFSIDEVNHDAMTWYADVTDTESIIYANFGDTDPNNETVEINVRKCCFYPEKTGINYITVRGFEMAQAACTWAPPTAEQFGLLGAHWSKGWIIEDNIIHDAKCSAISIGKNATIEDNLALKTDIKSGYQYQLESVFKAFEFGWTKENIGSHIVRNNIIYDCGQNGIVGHMGCAFSEIYNNHIYNISNKKEFDGWETAGIKLHAAIDVQIYNNCIHNCGGKAGMWLDWQTQGTRVSRNIFYDNDTTLADILVEVSHGPYMVDNNIFASAKNTVCASQGGAFVHNLFFGTTVREECLNRFTPYHYNHSTEVAGFCCIYESDDRWYQNIFAGKNTNQKCGTSQYDGCPTSMNEFIDTKIKYQEGTNDNSKQPAYINGNCYFNGAEAFDKEENKFVSETDINPQIVEEDGKVYLTVDMPEAFCLHKTNIIGANDLIPTRISGQPYEAPEGAPIEIDKDYFGETRNSSPIPGPFEKLSVGHNKILIRDMDSSK